MERWKKVVLAVAGVHVILVICGAAHLKVRPIPVIGPILHNYCAFTGADRQFGFFAPNVGSQLRGEFDLTDSKGNVTTRHLEEGVNREAQLRISNLISIFWDQVDDKDLRRAMAASMAAKMYNRYPDTKEVVVRYEAYELPPMPLWVEGARPYWKPFYRTKFVRNP